MTILLVQTALLLAIAYILGAITGCLLHRFWGFEPAAPVRAAQQPQGPGPAPQPPRRERDATPPAVPSDDLKQIRGIGKTLEARLNAAGVTTFAQIAAWTQADRERISRQLSFKGRIEREDWVGQARILARNGGMDPKDRSKQSEPDRG